MSIDLVAAAMWLDLAPARKLVLVALCDRAKLDTGECWPGRGEIARRASISERSVTTQIALLEEDGWLTSGPRPNRAGQTTHRFLNVKRILQEGDELRDEYRRHVQILHMQAYEEFAGETHLTVTVIEPSVDEDT